MPVAGNWVGAQHRNQTRHRDYNYIRTIRGSKATGCAVVVAGCFVLTNRAEINKERGIKGWHSLVDRVQIVDVDGPFVKGAPSGIGAEDRRRLTRSA